MPVQLNVKMLATNSATYSRQDELNLQGWIQRPQKPPSKLLDKYGNFQNILPPNWIRHFEFFKSDIKFRFSDPKNF